MGYDGIPISPADPGYGQWLQGQSDRRQDDRDRAYADAPQHPVVVQRDDLTAGEYFLALIVGPIVVGLIALVGTFLAGWDYTTWAVFSSLATFAIILAYGVLRVADYLLGLAVLVAIAWWVLHLIGIAPGLP
jgi:hypothetical protein